MEAESNNSRENACDAHFSGLAQRTVRSYSSARLMLVSESGGRGSRADSTMKSF